MSSINSVENTVVITDTSCLIILDKIGILHILHQLFETVLTTPEIAMEYGHSLPEWIVILAVKDKSFQKNLELLVDFGEASAIALAHEIDNKYIITDDLEARKLAIKRGLSVIGSLGVLLRAKEAGHISLVKPFIELMKQTNFRVADNLYQIALQKAGEK
jgi:predicted nucleic acid-binding protein